MHSLFATAALQAVMVQNPMGDVGSPSQSTRKRLQVDLETPTPG
jgi:hypothetical protein